MKPIGIAIAAGAIALAPGPVTAGWLPYGNPAVTETGNQMDSQIAPDGAGGVFVVWNDYRADSYDADIYIQHLDADGTPLFGDHGIRVCLYESNQRLPTVAPDGAGGAIVAWMDSRPGVNVDDIYAQRIDAEGNPLWAADGVPLCTFTNIQTSPQAIPDGAGGAIVMWEDWRFGHSDIMVRRVDASGVAMWAVHGVPLCGVSGDQQYPRLVSDGAGGAIAGWVDLRPGGFGVYTQRVSAAGALQWTNGGVKLAPLSSSVTLTPDGAGGAIYAWGDSRDHAVTGEDIYAQRLNAAGVAQWGSNGTPVCTALEAQLHPAIISDGAGGAIVVWEDARVAQPGAYDLYANHLDATGARTWSELAICTEQNAQVWPVIATDGAGGAIVAWQDHRSDYYGDVYAARILEGGGVAWVDGVSPLDFGQQNPRVVSDGAGGGFLVWSDSRTHQTTSTDVYVGRYYGNGVADVPAVVEAPGAIAMSRVAPNPSAGPMVFELRLSEPGDVVVEVFHASGRREALQELRSVGAGAHRITLDVRDTRGRPLPSGVYVVRARSRGAEASRRVSVVR